jgi:signal transduction histidine kinase
LSALNCASEESCEIGLDCRHRGERTPLVESGVFATDSERSRIRTERDGDERVRLTVRDAGVGLPAKSMDSLFDAFYTTKTGGMGIGLFVSRSIVERHHGRLWAQPNDGPGATFSFSVPYRPAGVTGAANALRTA